MLGLRKSLFLPEPPAQTLCHTSFWFASPSWLRLLIRRGAPGEPAVVGLRQHSAGRGSQLKFASDWMELFGVTPATGFVFILIPGSSNVATKNMFRVFNRRAR